MHMKEERFTIQNIPSILYGDSSEYLFLYIHGKLGSKEEAAQFAESVCPKGAVRPVGGRDGITGGLWVCTAALEENPSLRKQHRRVF